MYDAIIYCAVRWFLVQLVQAIIRYKQLGTTNGKSGVFTMKFHCDSFNFSLFLFNEKL